MQNVWNKHGIFGLQHLFSGYNPQIIMVTNLARA